MAALAAGFLLGLWKLYDLRFTAGDIYPMYSSLRADPLGTKALYESLEQIAGISTSRNYLALPSIPKRPATMFFLGQNPYQFEAMPEDEVKDYEALAASGARVVVAMQPVNRLREKAKPREEGTREPTALEKRWGVRFGYLARPANQTEESDISNPKLSALYFRDGEKVVYRLERPFGAGAILLLANCYRLSNEALAGERDAGLIAGMLGSNHQVIFDEHHLGLDESGGIVTLARKYHLEGPAAMLLLLLGLFIWKNSTSLLPPRAEPADDNESVAAEDARSGLANLLRRNIPAKALMKTCLEEWEGARHGGVFYSQAKIDRVRALTAGPDGKPEAYPTETYREVSRILSNGRNA